MQPQVLLTDLNMPNLDGFKFIRTLLDHKLFANLPIIAITGLTKDQVEANGGLPVEVQMLSKPIDMEWLRGFFDALISVRLMNGTERTDKTHLYIVVPRTRSINVAVQEFEELLKAEFKATRTKRTHVPIHRFAPTEVQGFKRETMRLTLDLMKNVFIDESLKSDALYQKVEDYLQKDRYKKQKNEIPKLFEDMTSGNEDAKRNIRRYRSRGKKILLNVASGKFP
jgi:CheY-like chemotaxis protein